MVDVGRNEKEEVFTHFSVCVLFNHRNNDCLCF